MPQQPGKGSEIRLLGTIRQEAGGGYFSANGKLVLLALALRCNMGLQPLILDKGKPAARSGRKAIGPVGICPIGSLAAERVICFSAVDTREAPKVWVGLGKVQCRPTPIRYWSGAAPERAPEGCLR